MNKLIIIAILLSLSSCTMTFKTVPQNSSRREVKKMEELRAKQKENRNERFAAVVLVAASVGVFKTVKGN